TVVERRAPKLPSSAEEAINILNASRREISSPEGCKDDSQVWSAKRDTPGYRNPVTLRTLKACEEFLAPLRGAPAGKTMNQGLRSFHSLNPWLSSLQPSGLHICNLMRQVY